ncbi:hypothetical protein TEA_011744 [Camellia sinensis var. sinensis]|uniref:Isopenicillin N synthase-like Fe(2+) 2OG dioxygenase domain-containing protein n=1 Tax=Camellia sinensis var. sinensis TaxID=542762 RepID=A0A4V3WKP8_CAMSN|nr:hypothetical protein TEA_011744 [Camellia sinensis var. sinensis]
MEEVQPTRRSVSMDSFSASMISAAIANAQSRESTQLAKVNQSNMAIIVPKKENVNQSLARLVGGSSIGRSLQKGPTSIKRSLSCSGKVFLSRVRGVSIRKGLEKGRKQGRGFEQQILSNGRYKSVVHRAVVNNKATWISIAMASGPSLDTIVSPAPELVEDGEVHHPLHTFR